MQPFLLTSVQFITYPVQTSDSSLFNRFLTPYNPSTYSPSIAFLFRTNVRLTPLQPLSYPFNYSHSIAIFIHLPSPNLLPFNYTFIHSQTSDLLPFNPFLTHLQSYLTLTNVRLTPLQTCYLPRTTVRLTPYNHLTYSPSNTLLILYKPLSNPTSIECLFRKNVRVIPSSNVVNASPFQCHTKVQIYPH